MNKIVFANFKDNEITTYALGSWQYNYGQILRIQGLSLPSAVEIHFSLQETGGEAVRRIGITKDGVTDVVIPDFILEGNDATRNYTAYAFIYLSDEESGETIHKIRMSVTSRSKPEGYQGTGDTTFGAILKAVNEIADGKADGLKYENSILKLMSGETELARVNITGGSGGTGREIELQKSDTAIQWRYVGDETWTDLVLLEDLKGADGYTPQKNVDYFDGNDGATPCIGENGNWWIGVEDTGVQAQGNDGITPHIGENGDWWVGTVDTGVKARGDAGYTPQKGVDYFDGTSVTVTEVTESTEDGGENVVEFSDGNSLSVKNGSKGDKGDKGDTPVKGTDYFTDADKAELVTSVLNALPTWEGGSY